MSAPTTESAAQPNSIDSQDAPPKSPEANVKPQPTKANRKRTRGPNYAKIHEKPLPLEVFPLPAFVPHNPLSLVRILGALISELFARQTSHPTEKYIGYFSYETRSIHVTDPKHVRALWEMGFFGKGTLSRSEPSWLDRETARRKAKYGGTSEEWTSNRRRERKLFKLERARIERETIEEQLRKEGKLSESQLKDLANGSNKTVTFASEAAEPLPAHQSSSLLADAMSGEAKEQNGSAVAALIPDRTAESPTQDLDDDLEADAPVENQEHLQLTLHEAFFLSYGLGVLSIRLSPTGDLSATEHDQTWESRDLLPLFATHSVFPPVHLSSVQPDNPFLLSYVVYHHYRSLGWVVRPGFKFVADWMLYNRGPVFSHAEFAVVIVPEYPAGWDGTRERRVKPKNWWEVHGTNRVQNHVVKTLVLCYVEVPLEVDLEGGDVAAVLKSYKVRDFVVRRWSANRMRD